MGLFLTQTIEGPVLLFFGDDSRPSFATQLRSPGSFVLGPAETCSLIPRIVLQV